MTTVEITVTLVIGTIVTLGLTTLFTDMFKMQRRATAVAALTQMRTAIIAAAQGTSSNPARPSAWDQTIADLDGATGNPDVGCLVGKTECNNDQIRILNLKQRDGTELFYSRTATRGFTFDGERCNTFTVAGNPLCPFRYLLRVRFVCVDGSVAGTGVSTKPSCVDPNIEINGDLLYQPGPDSPLGNQPLNLDLYQIRVRRSELAKTNIPIVISNVVNETAAGRVGEGTCDVNGGVARRFNTITDPSPAKATVAANSFMLRQGRYECRIEVPAFKNGGNIVRLVTVGAGSATIATATGTAPIQGGSTSISLLANFLISRDTTFQVMHQCESRPTANPLGSQVNTWAMGVPVPILGNYDAVVYTVVSCVKTG